MEDDQDWLTTEEAIAYVIKKTGVTREEAELWLEQHEDELRADMGVCDEQADQVH